jgi:hypothetical protein
MRSTGAVLGTTGAISVVTAINRLDMLPTRLLASSPRALEEGRVWLLVTSALVADRPAVPSIVGFAVVGLAAVALCGARAVWFAAVTGQLASALLVYTVILLTRLADPTAFTGVFVRFDYGTSAIIAAWIGAVAALLWANGAKLWAVFLCVAGGLIGWLFKNQLTALDTEHVVALCCGIAAMRYGARLAGLTSARDRLLRPLRAHAGARQTARRVES